MLQMLPPFTLELAPQFHNSRAEKLILSLLVKRKVGTQIQFIFKIAKVCPLFLRLQTPTYNQRRKSKQQMLDFIIVRFNCPCPRDLDALAPELFSIYICNSVLRDNFSSTVSKYSFISKVNKASLTVGSETSMPPAL